MAAAMQAALREAAAEAGIEVSELQGVGVGSPGNADERTGVVSGARNLPGWEGSFPLAETLSRGLGPRCGSGTTCRWRPKRSSISAPRASFSSLIGVFWGTGVGGGLVLDGKPWLGRGAAGEIGHMVIKRGGAPCPCGREGCVEAYAGRGAMEAEARKRQSEGTKTDLFKLMRKHERERLTSGTGSGRARARARARARGPVELIDNR